MLLSVRGWAKRRFGFGFGFEFGFRFGIGSVALALAPALLAVGPPTAGATPVTVVMGGAWDSVDDAGNVLGPSVQTGTSFTAVLTYNDATPDSNPSPTDGNYFVPPAQFSFTLSTGAYVFTHLLGGSNEIDVLNGPGPDSVSVFAQSFSVTPSLPAFGLNYANPSLYDPSGTALSSDALTAVPWTVAAWAARDMSFFADIADGNPNTYFQLDGTITTLTVVPEPGTLALVAVGVALLGGGRRRRG